MDVLSITYSAQDLDYLIHSNAWDTFGYLSVKDHHQRWEKIKDYGEFRCADKVVFENLRSILLFSTKSPSYKSITKLVKSTLVSPPY